MMAGKSAGVVALVLTLICGCGDDKASDASAAQNMAGGGGSGAGEPNLDIGEPDPVGGYLPGVDVEACAARVTELTVEINGGTYQLQQERGVLLNCCDAFSLTMEGCEPDTERCYTVLIEEEKLTLTEGRRGDGGVSWADPLEIRAVNEPEITDWPDTRCSIDGRPWYYWMDVSSNSAIGGDSISLSATVKAYVTGSSDCECQ